MSALFRYEKDEDSDEDDVYDWPPDLQANLIREKVLYELAGVLMHNQAEFGLGHLPVVQRFAKEEAAMNQVRCRSSEEVRAMPVLAAEVQYDIDDQFSNALTRHLVYYMTLEDVAYRYGPQAFYTYISKGTPSSAREVIWQLLHAAQNIGECWIPWMWISNRSLVCENEFSSVYTANVKPPFVGSQTSGQKVYLRKVKDRNLAKQVFIQIEGNGYSKDQFAITFDPEDGCIHLVELPGQGYDSDDGQSLEHEIVTPFNGWARVLSTLRSISERIVHPNNPRPDCHGHLHPKNIFNVVPGPDTEYRSKQYIWHRAVRECQEQDIYGRPPYLPQEAIAADARANLKWDVYAFGVIMWQLVSRIVFPPEQYMDNDVYQIDRVPGVPDWYEKLYMSCLDKDPNNRPELKYVQETLKTRATSPQDLHPASESDLQDVDPALLAYQNSRAEKVKAHLEQKSAPANILQHSTSHAYSRQEIMNQLGCHLVTF